MDNIFDTQQKKGVIINGIDGLLWKGNRLKKENKALDLNSEKISLSNTKIIEPGNSKGE